MQIELLPGQGHSLAKIDLLAGESITADAQALVAASPHVSIRPIGHIILSADTSEALESQEDLDESGLSRFWAKQQAGAIWLSGPSLGDIGRLTLFNSVLFVRRAALLAADNRVDIHLDWHPPEVLLGQNSATWLNVQGVGELLLAAGGAFYSLEVDGDQIVMADHLLAFDETLDVSPFSPSFPHAKGAFCRLRGRGRIWCQAQSVAALQPSRLG